MHTLLSSDTGVMNLVGTNIFPIISPQGTVFPSVTYHTIGTEPMEVIGWQKIADTIHVQIDVFASTYSEVINIKEAIKSVLDYKQKFSSNGLSFCGITPIEDMDGLYDKELNLFHRILKYEFHLNHTYNL